MEQLNAYKLERYKTAFSDYEAAVRKFNEGVLALSLQDRANGFSLNALTIELDVKHSYFLECVNRLTGAV